MKSAAKQVLTSTRTSESTVKTPKIQTLKEDSPLEDAEDNMSYTKFDDECYLWDKEEEEDDDEYSKRRHRRRRRLSGVGDPDKHHLGSCYYEYPTRTTPGKGYKEEIDFYHFRKAHKKREECFLFCVDKLPADQLQDFSLLVEATVMGLPRVVFKLKNMYGLDPLYHPPLGSDNTPGFNAVQEAIRGGHAEIIKILTDSNNDLVIDNLDRTVGDYVRMKGSSIRPEDAKSILSLDTNKEQMGPGNRFVGVDEREIPPLSDASMGWRQDTSFKVDERCDIDVIYGNMSREMFYNDYFMTGRPFVLRNAVPEAEIRAFAKSRWRQTPHFNPQSKVRVGPTAYPSMTDQEYCEEQLTIAEIEDGEGCEEQPGVPIVHARHPSKDDLRELFPMYKGNLYDRKGGWRKLGEWFDLDLKKSGIIWQVFFGGDASGATFHWHKAAFNVLYVGMKEWKLTPPKYRGTTGMPAKLATQKIDDSVAIRCTQRPGDFVFIPDYWGHLTVNHGFSIGAAAILPTSFQQAADAKPRVFFIHINKSGGTSMIKMLQNRCSQYRTERWNGNQRTFHTTAHALIDRNGRDTWDNAYTFAIVRHPLARVVSNFFFLVDQCSQKERDWCADRLIPSGLDAASLTDEEKVEAFHKYFQKLYDQYPPGSPNHYLFGSRGHGNEKFDTFNATQTSWLVDEKGEIAVKHVFHLEILSEDMSRLAEDLPCLVNDEAEERRNLLEMVRVNQTPKYPDYKLFGENERTNHIMKEVFAVDYQNFGYEF